MLVIHGVFKNKKVLGLIPARGASKRLPRKNLRQINGKPLIYWSIVEAQESEYVDSVVVSTEDIEIKQYSYNQGIDCVIDRPPGLAQDESRSIDVILHAVDVLAKQGKKYEYVMLLQPTSPLRTSKHIDDALKLMSAKKATVVVSVCETEHPVSWMGYLSKDVMMDEFLDNLTTDLSNDDDRVSYQINGAIYLVKTSTLVTEKTFFPTPSAYAHIMERSDSIDIDTELDLDYASYLMTRRARKFT